MLVYVNEVGEEPTRRWREVQHPPVALGPPDLRGHYDLMEQLDAEVHDDSGLASAEVDAALRLAGSRPFSVFLPCFGTGRHIPALLACGVRRIVGVDFSPRCVAKARAHLGDLSEVELHEADLTTWRTLEPFDLVLLLGNSFADITDLQMLLRVTQGMVSPLSSKGRFVMDYIGEGYLERCRVGTTTTWTSRLNNKEVRDKRTPGYDPATRVMTIRVEAQDPQTDKVLERSSYQKLIMDEYGVQKHFAQASMGIASAGKATRVVVGYYHRHPENALGMIAASTWWVGRTICGR